MLRQVGNSLHQILTKPHVPKARGMMRYVGWQGRRALNLFPFEQRISASRIVAAHRRCSVSALIYSQGLYDYDNMQLIQWLLREGGVFWDVGANIGSYTLVASEPDVASVVSFEPHPGTFQILAQNVEMNHRRNVQLFNLALGPTEDVVFLSNEQGSSTNCIEERPSHQTVPVPCRPARAFCTDPQLRPQYVKIDVEGYEYDVLVGFAEWLPTIELLMIEINGLSDSRGCGQDLIDHFLADRGFSGPWRCDFDHRVLLPLKQPHTEDAIYFSAPFRQRAQVRGLAIAEGL